MQILSYHQKSFSPQKHRDTEESNFSLIFQSDSWVLYAVRPPTELLPGSFSLGLCVSMVNSRFIFP